jgi:hypothetical protein
MIIAHKKVTEHLAPLKDPNTLLPDQTTGDKKIIKLGGTQGAGRFMPRPVASRPRSSAGLR